MVRARVRVRVRAMISVRVRVRVRARARTRVRPRVHSQDLEHNTPEAALTPPIYHHSSYGTASVQVGGFS